MKFKIGYRTLKTAIGTSVAIIIAQFFEFSYFSSAGIITILCIQNSKKKSLQSASQRFIACSLAILFSFVFFEGITYHPIVIGLMLLFFIPTTVITKAKEGIVTSSVIILHIYSEENMTWNVVFNEFGLIIIGIGVALIVNLYMPSLDDELKQYQKKLENNFRSILKEIAAYLRTNETNWTGKEITETAKLLEEAKSLAFRDVENHFMRSDNYYYHYFKIREKQFEIIERALPLVTSIDPLFDQRYMIADFLEELSLSVHPGNTAKLFLIKLRHLREEFREMPLPHTREEFEARADLLHFVKEIEQYLVIKTSLKLD
ncbi:aromatic acid exporter family protein [Bacillus sp. CGMCC 1.16541]|uniref:aromatic acid exporter family protein n=1 Tax=Bacillus sp. CGMCC 1.16541 TaxID=2185143 RepID=UPI000D731989|nr:aromatic acid exporter family protein [Bacillus sp. CGMCC 1.16541]